MVFISHIIKPSYNFIDNSLIVGPIMYFYDVIFVLDSIQEK